MDRTVVRCADGHLFSTSTFPMQNLGQGRIGPGRLLRCPACGRLRSCVPAGNAGQYAHSVAEGGDPHRS
ncbi:hypothetical protein [Allostreptomyces psammosilenae]|uniref:Uncharacterized protein n=1 Tax=Allostreptomyces psammosilenae TaxID=1892865 RepID=A0A852ZSA8_9ACTN|nr:hypothetical protein [Allostreptomyces psammosilenae]NYI05273.1 hypothetical protein [Allostreptomyces psammosilenae]